MTNNLAICDHTVNPDDSDIHHLEHIGSILRRLRAGFEAQMTTDFNLPLSLTIDELVQREKRSVRMKRASHEKHDERLP